MAKSKTRRGCLIAAGVAVLLCGLFLASGPGQAFLDIWRSGAIQDAMSEKPKGDYSATSAQNLRALQTALSLYHDSEGQFPQAAGWMDAIENRLAVNDIKPEEAKKKLIRPDKLGTPDAFGYAMNDAVAGKYKGDLKDPKTPLIYESKQSTRNAHGNPESDHEGPSYVSIDGAVRKFGAK